MNGWRRYEGSPDHDVCDSEARSQCHEDAMPRDRKSLEHELARLDHVERTLQLETATEFVQEDDVLLAARHQEVKAAHAARTRRHLAAQKLCAYSSQKARDTYASRCLALKRAMQAEFEEELCRLQTAKDGVSVTSRRRRTVRPESFGTLEPPTGTRRPRGTATSDRATVGTLLVPPATAQGDEKRRLEQLLGRTSVFEPAVVHATPMEVREDLHTIQRAVATSGKATEGQLETPRRRRRILTPRIPRTGARDGSVAVPHETVHACRWPRVRYNPQMVQEGQEVQVFQRVRTLDDKARRHDVCILCGIFTAATRTHVYVLPASGRFESFDVRDCLLGSLYVRIRAPKDHTKRVATSRQDGSKK